MAAIHHNSRQGKINHMLTVNKPIMQQSGLPACVLNHPLAAGRVDCAEVSVVTGQGKKWSPMRSVGTSDGAHPPKCDSHSHFPAQCCLVPAQKGAGRGERSAIIMMWKTRESILEKYCMKKQSHPFI